MAAAKALAVNGSTTGGKKSIGNYTIYVNPYVVVRNSQVTKHFYIESQRIATKLAESNEGLLQTTAGSATVKYSQKQAQLQGSISKLYADLGIETEKVAGTAGNSGNTPPGQNNGNPPQNGNNGNGNDNTTGNAGGNGTGGNGNGNGNTGSGNGSGVEKFIFYYHPDHLGSSSYISDANGEVTQHLEYFAFGETFLEEHSNTDTTPYLFNGNELDEETGLYYYGARYYDARTSVWASVDPLAEKTPNESPYIYCGNNPIVFIDPDGRFKVPIHEKIIQEAMANLGYKRYDHMALWTSQQTWDSFGAMNDEIHFDNRFTSGQVYSSWNILNQRIAKAKLGNVNDPMTHFGVDNDIQLGGYMLVVINLFGGKLQSDKLNDKYNFMSTLDHEGGSIGHLLNENKKHSDIYKDQISKWGKQITEDYLKILKTNYENYKKDGD